MNRRSTIRGRGRRGLFVAAALLALLAPAGLAAEGPSWRLEKGDVKILVPLKPGSVRGDHDGPDRHADPRRREARAPGR